MSKTRIAVFVSGGGTNLQALIDYKNKGNLKDGEIALVVSNKAEVYALERAAKDGIKSCVIERHNYDSKLSFEKALINVLEENKIDLIVLAGFTYILTSYFVGKYPNRIMNIHPSLIPAFCGKGFYGLKVHEAALERGVKLTGCTVHFVNEEADGGPIIMQKAIEVLENDTPESLQLRVMENCEWVLYPMAIQSVCKKLLKRGK